MRFALPTPILFVLSSNCVDASGGRLGIDHESQSRESNCRSSRR
jgi:hypothetical protein